MDSAIDKDPEAGTEPDVEALLERIAKQARTVNEQAAQIAYLKEQIALYQRKFFAARSEKIDPKQLRLFNEAEQAVDEGEARGDVDEE